MRDRCHGFWSSWRCGRLDAGKDGLGLFRYCSSYRVKGRARRGWECFRQDVYGRRWRSDWSRRGCCVLRSRSRDHLRRRNCRRDGTGGQCGWRLVSRLGCGRHGRVSGERIGCSHAIYRGGIEGGDLQRCETLGSRLRSENTIGGRRTGRESQCPWTARRLHDRARRRRSVILQRVEKRFQR